MTDLWSGLHTQSNLEAMPPHLRVNAIAWDSPFRAAGLAPGDRIVAVDGARLPQEAALQHGQLAAMIGQSGENAGFTDHNTISLRIHRRAPASGWTESEVTASPIPPPAYRDSQNNEVLGIGGPSTLESDGFETGGWGGWSEQIFGTLFRILDVDQHGSSFVSHVEGQTLRDTYAARCAFAGVHYPGPWSTALAADFKAALAICDGVPVELPPNALDFRRRGEMLVAEVRTKAQADWTAFQAAHAAETVPASPAPDPSRDDISHLVGLDVVLPPLGNDGYLEDGGRNWFAAGSPDDGWFFLDAEGPPAQAMLRAQRRYTKLVDPDQQAQWEFVARITGDPRLCAIGQHAYFGLICTPLAALVGGAMFVDLTALKAGDVAFSGEAGLIDPGLVLPADTASPSEVVAAVIGAVKAGDLRFWKSLHAAWWIESVSTDHNRTTQIIHPIGREIDESRFEDCRRSLGGRVLDARPVWTDDPATIIPAGRFVGAEAIEEVTVTVEHVGQFGTETRTFSDVTTNTCWKLQRIGDGPWRVAEPGMI